ncbi:DUF3631 domain-containing protein [Mycobacterium avium]|uniref:DUF3631 domain-containing protein n=1 Tax=Mycobacterium avium TaxID=1764 RepID=UPI000A0037D3|nr:DUF3631 domain-containing protein [Mycobacterium avium]
MTAQNPPSGDEVLRAVRKWLKRFIAVTHNDDLTLLALWIVHTHLVNELWTTPRLLIDSIMPGSGKTTVLEHCERLCNRGLQAALLSSPALIPRILDTEMRTILLDEVDRSLRENKDGVQDLIAVINSGYKRGATRPVLVPSDNGWTTQEMPTYAPVAMAGNDPRLPADTLSRSIRILMMPDSSGRIEDSDWELYDEPAKELRERIAEWADSVRDDVPAVDLPDGCIGRMREKWRPLMRVAVMAGGPWPKAADKLIRESMKEDQDEREAGLKQLPPGMVLLNDLRAVWPEGDDFVSTEELVRLLIKHNRHYWGTHPRTGNKLNAQRLGRIINQATKRTSSREDGRTGPRGFWRSDFKTAWSRMKTADPE